MAKAEPTAAAAVAGDRIRWEADEEAATSNVPRPLRRRTASVGSLSIHSIPSVHGPVDPAAELPIQYRTV